MNRLHGTAEEPLQPQIDAAEQRLIEMVDELEDLRAKIHMMASPDLCYPSRLNGARYAIYRAVGKLVEAHAILTDETQKLQGAPCGGSNPRKRKKKNVWGEEIDE